MNYVIAKIKSKTHEYEKLFSGAELYQMPDGLEGAVEYQPSRLLEEGEWYKLQEFSTRSFCIDLLKDHFRSTDYPEASKVKTMEIEYICSYQERIYFFQRVFKHNIVMHKRITLGDNVRLDKGERSIVINDNADGIYVKDEDVLYFRKLQTIAPIFKGIEDLYKEATQEETELFLTNDFIELDNSYNADKVKKMNRKRIAMAMDTLNGFDRKQKRRIQGVFTIGSEEDMKYLLWGIEQRYYTTPVTKENRVANSVMVLPG